MKRPLVNPLDRNATKEAGEMATFYEETLGFTPNSLFTMMHRPRIAAAFLEMNKAVMENAQRYLWAHPSYDARADNNRKTRPCTKMQFIFLGRRRNHIGEHYE